MSLITVNLRLVSPYGTNDVPLVAAGRAEFTPLGHGKYHGALRTIETINASIVQGVMEPKELTPGAWSVKVMPLKGAAWPEMKFVLEEGMPEPVNLAELAPEIVINGAQLARGASAYEIAVADGFEGSEKDWLASLVGSIDEVDIVSHLESFVPVTRFGAVGDGITDSTEAFTQAMSSGESIFVPSGQFLVSGAVANNSVDLVLGNNSEIVHNGTGPAIQVEGSESTEAVALSTNAPALSKSVTVTSEAHGLVAGDYVRLGSELLWDSFSTKIRHGEILQVASVDGPTVYFTTPIQGGPYNTDESASLWGLDLIDGVRIRGAGTIRGAKTPNLVQTGIVSRLARNTLVSGISMKHIDYRHIAFEDVVDSHIVRTDHDWAQDAGMAYGIAISNASQDVTVTGSTFRDVRHFFTTSNLAAVRGIVRRVKVTDNVSKRTLPALNEASSGGDGLDTHTAADHITFDRNLIESPSGQGINVEARNSTVRWNTIIHPVGAGISIHSEGDQDGSTVVVGNRVVAGPNTTYGIRIMPTTRGSGKTLRGVIVNQNIVEGVQSTPIYIGSTGGPTLYGVTAHDNFGINCPGSHLIRIYNSSGVVHSGNSGTGGTGSVLSEDLAPLVDAPGFLISNLKGTSVNINPSTTYLRVAVSGTGTLNSINGGSRGQIIVVRLSLASSSLVLGTTGNITLLSPFTLSGVNDSITLANTGTAWVETARADFA